MEYTEAKGWLTAGERTWLFSLASYVADTGWIINIGIEYGASLVCLRSGAPRANLVGIDLLGDSKLAQPVRDLIVVKANSTVVGRAWLAADLVFVDGGHDYETVLQDAMLWSALLPPLGHIAFHDCYESPAAQSVNTAVERWHSIYTHFEEMQVVDSIRTFYRN